MSVFNDMGPPNDNGEDPKPIQDTYLLYLLASIVALSAVYTVTHVIFTGGL